MQIGLNFDLKALWKGTASGEDASSQASSLDLPLDMLFDSESISSTCIQQLEIIERSGNAASSAYVGL